MPLLTPIFFTTYRRVQEPQPPVGEPAGPAAVVLHRLRQHEPLLGALLQRPAHRESPLPAGQPLHARHVQRRAARLVLLLPVVT